MNTAIKNYTGEGSDTAEPSLPSGQTKVKALGTDSAKPKKKMEAALTALNNKKGTKKVGNTAATENEKLLENMTAAETAAKTAYDRKETMLTAYCVQTIALGGDVANDLAKGREWQQDINMGAYKTAADSVTGAQFGKTNDVSGKDATIETDPTSNKPYRCLTSGATALASGVTVQAPGDVTINSARSAAQGANTPKKELLDKLVIASHFYKNVCTDGTPNQATCTAAPLSTTCEWNVACKQKLANNEQDIASMFAKWKTLSDATMDAFKAMIEYKTGYYTEVSNAKQCKSADNTHT